MTSIAAPSPGAWQPGTLPAAASVPAVRHSSHLKVIGLLALSVALVIGVIVAVASALTPAAKHYVCPPDCGGPPTVKPLSANPRFAGPGGAYSVEYWSSGQAPIGGTVATSGDRTGVTMQLSGSDATGTVRLFGTDAQGRTAQQEATALVSQAFPGARRAYVVPNAFVGYQPGYGEVDDVQVQSSNGGYADDRLVVMVGVKNGVALVGEAFGPYQAATPDTSNHASAVGLAIAGGALDPLINTFVWQGDPPR